jgi:hypothetical protein
MTQILPVWSRGLAAVDLFFTALPELEGSIEVEIVDLGGQTIARAAPRSPRACRLGANRFDFPAGAGGPDREAILRVRVISAPGTSLGLATGAATAVARFAPRVDGEPVGDRVLAMKIWRGLPGVSLPPAPTFRPNVRRSSLVMPADLPEAQKLSAGEGAALSTRADRDAILLQASIDGPVLAIVPGLEVEGLVSVSGFVHVPHPSSPTLGFAVAGLPAGEAERLAEPASALGDWIFLPANGWGAAHHHFPRPFSGKLDLLLAVSATAPGNRHTKGAFRSFRFGFADDLSS